MSDFEKDAFEDEVAGEAVGAAKAEEAAEAVSEVEAEVADGAVEEAVVEAEEAGAGADDDAGADAAEVAASEDEDDVEAEGAEDAEADDEVDADDVEVDVEAAASSFYDEVAPVAPAEPREDFVIGEEDELDQGLLDEELEGGAFPERLASPTTLSGVDPEELARLVAQAAYDKKADDVVVLDLTGLSDVCDYFVIATGANARLVDSVIDEIDGRVKETFNENPFSVEGRQGRNWILMDYGSVVVHVFTPEMRAYYRLEKLWGDAPQLELDLY